MSTEQPVTRRPEMRGQWPGGWREEDSGQLGFPIRGAGDGTWACEPCRKGLLHTLAEHELLTGEK